MHRSNLHASLTQCLVFLAGNVLADAVNSRASNLISNLGIFSLHITATYFHHKLNYNDNANQKMSLQCQRANRRIIAPNAFRNLSTRAYIGHAFQFSKTFRSVPVLVGSSNFWLNRNASSHCESLLSTAGS